MSERTGKPPLAPLDWPTAPFVAAGTAIWALVGLAMLATDARTEWLWTCLAGFLLGVALLGPVWVHDRRRHQR